MFLNHTLHILPLVGLLLVSPLHACDAWFACSAKKQKKRPIVEMLDAKKSDARDGKEPDVPTLVPPVTAQIITAPMPTPAIASLVKTQTIKTSRATPLALLTQFIYETATDDSEKLRTLLGNNPKECINKSHGSLTPLQASISCHLPLITQALIDNNADVNFPADYPPIVLSCTSTHDESQNTHKLAIIKSLLAAQANVNATDCNGRTALWSICDTNCDTSPVVQCLLDAGADTHAVHKNTNALQLAHTNNNTPVRQLLFNSADKAKRDITLSNLSQNGDSPRSESVKRANTANQEDESEVPRTSTPFNADAFECTIAQPALTQIIGESE